MSRISNLLAQIMSAVYGKDVRQSIHDAIEQCYTDVSNAKTIADASTTAANTAAANASAKATAADTAASGANAATQAANTAATAANQAAIEASTRTTEAVNKANSDISTALNNLGLAYVDGKLCTKVERVT